MKNPNYTDHDREVAHKVIELAERHEASWSQEQQTYTMGSFKPLCHSLLRKEPNQTAMVMLLDSFAVQWSNDLIDFCNAVLENKHYS